MDYKDIQGVHDNIFIPLIPITFIHAVGFQSLTMVVLTILIFVARFLIIELIKYIFKDE